jgi:hypothetical protein
MNGLLKTTRANFPFSDRLRRNRHSKQILPKSLPKRQDFSLEPLESRLLLSVGLVGVPDWVEQGPAVSINGQTAGLAAGGDPARPNPVVGAIEAIASHPSNANIIYVGTVAGGVWRTTDGGANWAALSDQAASLSISTIAFSPLDATNNTLFAGTGSFSSGGNGGSAVGALRTTDGGVTWTSIGSEFSGERVRALVPTSIGTSLADQVVLAATIDFGGGVYRSTNGGTTFALVSGTSGTTDGLDNDANGLTDEFGELNLPTGNASHLVRDPTNANRFYAALPGTGVFRSDNGGADWVQVNGTGGNILTNIGASTRIELSVSAAGGAVYAALINGGALANVFRSPDQGANWTSLGAPAPTIHPGGQAGTHFSILADNVANDVVYVGGDVQAASGVGNLSRNNAGAWTPIVLGGAGGTAPHADSRDMVFDFNNNILESDDGGIYRLVNPNAAGTTWQAFATMPHVGQFITNMDYDRLNNMIVGGTQDTGSPEQVSGLNWRDTSLADGGFVAVDNDQVAHPGTTLHYSSAQFFSGFARTSINNANVSGVSTPVGLVVAGAGGSVLNKNVIIAGNRTNTFDASLPFLPPFVLNAIDPDRMLIGTSFLYESTNNGDTLTSLGGLNNLNADGLDNDLQGGADEGDEFTPAGAIGPITAMAYGGRSGGADNVDLAYVASGATLRLRTANTTNTMADFAIVTGYTGGAIRDIELDPDDWHRGYVIDTSNRVFSFVNSGATTTWNNVTGNLASFSGDIRDVELFTPTTAPGDDILLVGGFGGVFRTLAPSASSVWSEYGGGNLRSSVPNAIPNLIVTDLLYDAARDVLVAGTYGRGAWTVSSVSTTIGLTGVLQINGDTDFAGEDDTIRLIRDTNNTSLLDVFLNGALSQFQLSTLQQINVNGLGGKDTLIVDSSNGLITVVNGIRYDGGDFFDNLQLAQTGGPTRTSDTYSVGPDIGSGVSTIAGPGTAGTQTVFFEDLEPVLDLVPAFSLTVNATATDNAINYSVGTLLTQGLVTIDEHESIEFSNKTKLTINAGAGQDTISVNNPNTPTGLTGIPGITINGGDPSSGDTLIVTGVGVAVPVTVNTATATINGATGAGGAVSIHYDTLENLNLLAGIGALTITTTGADDSVTVTPGLAAGGANSGSVQSSGAVPQIAFVNSGDLTANLGAGDDALVVNGSSDADTVAVDGAAVVITNRRTVNYSGVEALSVNGNAGSDTFNVTPSLTVAMFIDGGDPIGALPGDLLNIIAGGGSVTFNAGPEIDEGSFVVDANEPVSFDHIESFGITGPGGGVINGTNGPDAITVIARDDSTDAAADGVQDFTVSVNAGPELLFINTPSLTVNALSGSDQVTLQTPAPNNAVWDVDVTVNGGAPAADTDTLIVQTPKKTLGAPGDDAETAVYTPTTYDGGTLDLTSLSSLVTITTTEELIYDGQGDNDSLKIVGTSDPDTIVYTPGANDQAGTFQVNSLLALSYQNLGSGGSLKVDGAGGTDTLVYNGTANDDTFTINNNAGNTEGIVTLNSRLALNTAGVEILTLNGLAGDDTFTLVPAISASVYQTINFNGGGQASAAGDRVYLFGTMQGDEIRINGSQVVLGNTINSNGIEDIILDARGGDDLITYNGVSGVIENIRVSSSNTAGGGQLSVPGVTLVDFSNVERIDVIGNTSTLDEPEDTLTFAGTNAADTFNINLAAAGTDADPILKLLNSSGTQLLTLRNYTNFNTLNVLGLDGTDTFNVTTAATGPSRDLFVDGGLPTGKKKSTDNLNIFYTPPRPSIIHSAATQDPDAGIVDLDYDTARFVVEYDDIEQVTIRKG